MKFKRIKKNAIFLFVICLFMNLVACNMNGNSNEKVSDKIISDDFRNLTINKINDNYNNYYEVFLYSFADSNGDGIGDINGLVDKIDYINDGDDKTINDLGLDGIWLMPINPSPTYHKYDVINYKEIDPQYGSLEDFDNLVKVAHDKGIKIIIDLVMNHTSDQHPWFEEAVAALEAGDLDNKYIDYYHFKENKASSSYYQAGNSKYYYEGKFWSGMPDLNLDNTNLRNEFKDIMNFWLVEHNIDGFRLDAIKEFDSGNDKHNIEILEWISSTAKTLKPNAYLVGEAWYEFSEYKEYYKSGLDSLFDFSFAEQSGLTVKAINSENGQSYAKSLATANKLIWETNSKAINAPFLSNHDTGRLAGFLGSNENKLRLAAASNLFTTGNSFIYYGEEIGMRGAGKDENKRAYLYWSDNDKYQTKGAQIDENGYGYPFGSIEDQNKDPKSLLNYYKKAIRIVSAYPEISRGMTIHIDQIKEKELAPLLKIWTDDKGQEHESLIIINYGTVDITSNLSKTKYANYKLQITLDNHQGNNPTLEDNIIKLPPATVAILKKA